MILEVFGYRLCELEGPDVAKAMRDVRWVAGWARFLLRVALTAAIGCGGAPYQSEFTQPAGSGTAPLDVAGCFPQYAEVNVTMPSSARVTSRNAMAAGPTSMMCANCAATHGYTTYDGNPPNSTCFFPVANPSIYCCTDALCVPRVPSQCPGYDGPPGGLGSVPTYSWSCADGATPPASWGCVANPLSVSGYCCNEVP